MTYSYDRVRTGRRIQARRMALELTQEQLAERMDCSLRFVADVERGAVGMSIDSLMRACATLHTSPDALLRDGEAGEAEGGEAALDGGAFEPARAAAGDGAGHTARLPARRIAAKNAPGWPGGVFSRVFAISRPPAAPARPFPPPSRLRAGSAA